MRIKPPTVQNQRKQKPDCFMRKFYALAIALMTTLFVSAQIGVTVTGNTNTTPALQASYTSLAAAFSDLNAVTG